MMNRSSINFLAALVFFSAAPAKAQHIDILAFDADGKIGIGEYNFDTLSAVERRVHLARFSGSYVVDNPGFAAIAGADPLPGNQELTWEFLPLTVDSGPHSGYRSTLLYWDGTGGSPAFGPTATDDYELSISSFYGSAAAMGTDGIEQGSILSPTPPNGTIHEHPEYFIDDNGDGVSATLPEAGIYLIGLRLNIDGLEQSDPFYMVWATPEIAVLPAIQPAGAWVNARVDSLYVESVAGDFDGDTDVDGSDFLQWQRDHVALGGAEALSQWQTNYGSGLAATVSALLVPEPSSLKCMFCLFAFFQLVFLRSRV